MQGYQSNETIKVIHKEVEIIYDDRLNQWHFTLRGNERHATSLSSAKEAIDRPYKPKVEGPKFDRVHAFTTGYGDIEEVEVTSRIGSNHFRYRFTHKKPGDWRTRGTQSCSGGSLFPRTPENMAKAEVMKGLTAKIEELTKERTEVRMSLQTLEAYLRAKDAEELTKSGVDTDIGKE